MQFPAGEISSYTVPAGVQTLRITAEGAGGGDSFHSSGDPTQTSGGPGAVLTGRVTLESETELSILVGEFPGSSTNIDCSGGGGGSFVGVGTDLNAFSGENLLFVAGGGGGACNGDGGEGGTPDGEAGSNQVDGNSGEPGGYGGIGNGDGGNSGHAGAGGGGGAAIDDHGNDGTANNPGSNLARGGAGGSGAGGNGGDAATEATGGQAAVNGGSGGEYGGPFNATNGGFGGGGAGGEYGGGGGGGYAGGGGGGYNRGGGGGGSSFFADEVTDRTMEASNAGHGTVFFCLRSIQPDPGNILYVDQNVTGGNQTGDSWENALPELRDALRWAADEWDGGTDGTLQIWVAEGVYLPTGDPGDRDAAFPLLDQVEIHGGFPPGGGTWEDRDWKAYPAVLSGQVDEDDETIRSVHVVTANDVGNSAILDGFTVTGGGDSTNPGRAGGGLYVSDASPTLSHLAILGNRVSGRGGGMYSAGGDPVLLNVRFAGNQAAMGGGMSVHDSNPDMVNVEFLGNRATSDFFGGGGLHATDADPLLINAIFSGNWASGNRGGAIFNRNSSPVLRNVIIWNNRATGAPITSSIHNEEGSAPHIAHSLIEDSGGSGNWYGPIGIDGGDNIDAPPLFVDMPDWHDAPVAVGDLRLDRASPAVDRGDPDTDMSIFPAGIDGVPVDLGGDQRVYDGAVTVIDMGAYEFQGDRFELAPDVDNILYVDANVDTSAADYTGAGDSWDNAVSELADALLWTRRQHDVSEGWSDPDGEPLHIYIARGTYTPRYNANDNLYHANGNRDNAFVVVPGVHLYGGFDPENGITELGDPRLLPGPNPNRGTILSGILAGGNGDVYHVLVASRAIGNPPRVDGVSITGGEADGEDWIMVYGSRVYRNGGGGLRIVDTPMMLVNAYIRANSAVQGGGIHASNFSPTLINVAIVGNSADDGGGMFSTRGEPELINATISGNTASGQGGGLYIDDLTVLFLRNSILRDNTAGGGGNEVYNNYGMWFTDSVYRDRDGENDIAGDGWFNTSGVTTDDPHFADPASDDLRLLPSSPAIFTGSDTPFQAGEPAEGVTTDLAGNPRFVDGQIDPGAWQNPGFVLAVTPEQQAAALGAAYAPITVTANARTDTGFADPGDYPLAGGEVMAAYPESGATVIFDGVIDNPFTLVLDGDGQAVTPEPVAAGEVGDFWIEVTSQGADPVAAQMRNLALYAVTATVAGGNGAITPDEQIVVEGEDAVVTVTPDTGWHIDSVAGDTCTPADQGDGTWAVENITADCAVSAIFAINEYAVTANAGENGSTAPAVQNVAHGGTAIFTVTPDTGWHVDSVTGDTCNPVDQGDGTWAAENITADCAVSAVFAINEYTVAASAGENGGIAPDAQTVTHGGTAEFTVTPNAGYSATITGDCPAGDLKGETYSTGPVIADCEVIANFTRNPPAGLVIDGGGGQSAAVNTEFAEPLAVRVHDGQGDPLPGIAVNFEVQEAGGAGAMLSAAQAETDDQGLAAITATANGTAGDYTVTATVAGLEPVVFALTNTVLETTLELTASADTIDQGDTLILTATVAGAAARGSVIPTGTVDFRTGNRTLCDAVELVDGIAACEVDNLPAGEHLIEANYGGDAAFAAAAATVTVTVEGEVPEAVVIPTTSRVGLLLLALMSLIAGLRAIRAGG